ncbi:MAG: tRNA pseudouridine(38-40) synthase TruA [Victivallales bacterium]|nr:tRNA pseudouridine(38-40) synthase TruA [Victivallales bacterium]
MPRMYLEVSYDGSDYGGWQRQPDVRTVQEEIERRLSELYVNQPVVIHSSGRTDAGVHAVAQPVTFDVPEYPGIPPENLLQALNNSLPDSIRINCVGLAPSDDFHARFSAVGKAYCYIINRGDKTPFNSRYSWHVPGCIDDDAVRRGAGHLVGEHDFAAFTNSRKDDDGGTVRRIFRIDVREFGYYLAMTFVGGGFLYKMVRNMAGVLALVGSGTHKPEDVLGFLKCADRSELPKPAPARGLFLMKAFYSEEDLAGFQLNHLPFGH